MKGRWARIALDWMGALFLVSVVALGFTGEWGGPAAAEVFAEGEALQAAATDGKDPFRIVIDAGHGGPDGGAEGQNTGVKEDGLNLAVAKLLEQELLEMGFDVTMTRKNDDALAPSKRGDMEKRGEIMGADGVSAVVSVHMNRFSDRAVSGPMAFYMKGSAEGEKLAGSVIESLCTALGRPARPANPGDYFVLRESAAPAVIVECGFLSNPEDEALLQDKAHQEKLAKGIAAGVAAYFAA